MAKKRVGTFPKVFRQMAVDRLMQCDNIVELAKELGISRRLLYTWREKLEPRESHGPPVNSREATLRKEVSQLKRVLAEKVLEVDFSKGPCTPSRRDASGADKLRAGKQGHSTFPPVSAVVHSCGGSCRVPIVELSRENGVGGPSRVLKRSVQQGRSELSRNKWLLG